MEENAEITGENKRSYNADRDYVLQVSSTSGVQSRFLKIVNNHTSLVDNVGDATRMSSTESNRIGVDYFNKFHIIPMKLKICNYKNFIF